MISGEAIPRTKQEWNTFEHDVDYRNISVADSGVSLEVVEKNRL